MNGDQHEAIGQSDIPESRDAEPVLVPADTAEQVNADPSSTVEEAIDAEPRQGEIPDAAIAVAESDLSHADNTQLTTVESTEPPVYIRSVENAPIRQGEILSNVMQHKVFFESLADPGGLEVQPVIHDYAIVLSQDCDLEQDFNVRQAILAAGATPDPMDDKLLPNVLLCFLATESSMSATLPGRDIRKRFKQNKEDRYQYLRAVEPADDAEDQGLQALGIDFRRYFTVPTDELYAQIGSDCLRRCRLAPQYLEHLSCRFANFLSRVGLPRNHDD